MTQSTFNILIPSRLPDFIDEVLTETLSSIHYQCYYYDQLTPEQLPTILNTIHGIYCFDAKLDGLFMDRMKNLKVISNFGVGVDHINLEDAKARNIIVGNSPNVVDAATADTSFALLLAAARNIVTGDRDVRQNKFIESHKKLGQEVNGSVIGILGLGNIGKQVAIRARAFNMQILYHNRNRNLEAEKLMSGPESIEYVSMDELFKRSDFVVLCVPLNSNTRHLVQAKHLALMKPTSILVNIARGGIIDQNALLQVLEQKKIYAAALDVTDPEPLPDNHPLLKLDNVVIIPHYGTATQTTRRKMASLSAANLKAGLLGETLPARKI